MECNPYRDTPVCYVSHVEAMLSVKYCIKLIKIIYKSKINCNILKVTQTMELFLFTVKIFQKQNDFLLKPIYYEGFQFINWITVAQLVVSFSIPTSLTPLISQELLLIIPNEIGKNPLPSIFFSHDTVKQKYLIQPIF